MFVGVIELQLFFSEVPTSFFVPLMFGLHVQFCLCNYFRGVNDILCGFGEYKSCILLSYLACVKFHDVRFDSLGVMNLTYDLSCLVHALCRFGELHCLT